MAWYNAGTVNVANGSANVVGTNTDFVANVAPGDIFSLPGTAGIYEVASIQSATQLTLARPWIGGGGAGQPYAIAPTQSFARDLANAAALLLTTFGAVRDGIGQGLIGDGSAAAPGIRFAADPDTGIYRVAGNVLAIATAGVERFRISGDTASFGAGTTPVLFVLNSSGTAGQGAALQFQRAGNPSGFIGNAGAAFGSSESGDIVYFTYGTDKHRFFTSGGERARIDENGNLLVGVTSGTSHTINKGGPQGTQQLNIFGAAAFFIASGGAGSSAASAAVFATNTATGRSINAGGTINASGADYAEYMTKCDGCGTIAAGEVCGVTAQGTLTRTWGDAVAFVVKSTDPSYVGGDTWTQALPPRPTRANGETDAAFATRQADWDQQLEAERVKVDRIAFCGQAPVTMTGSFAPGDYVVAAANGSGIKAVAVAPLLITFEQYKRRIGRVWRTIDATHAWVDVQHG